MATLESPDRFVPIEGDIGRPEVGKRLFNVAIERFGQVDALYLVDAEFTTGVVLPVDGGATAGRW